MMKIYYKNHQGQIVNLTTLPYLVTDTDLFDYEWKYENRNSQNPQITRFHKELAGKKLKIAVSAKTKNEYNTALMHLFEVVERDVLKKKQGKLYVGEEYLPCYIFKSQKTDYYRNASFIVNTFSVVSETGTWIKESIYSYSERGRSDSETDEQYTYMDYPYDYSYDYASTILAYTAPNEGFSEADFALTVMGPCVNPEISIAGHIYRVDASLEAGEQLKIDSLNRKIYKIRVNGEQINQFHLRDREHSVFKKIPEGNNVVTWDGSFRFELTLYEGRSEPRWT